MTQPNMPNMPGAEAVNDTLEFVRNLWGGGMKIPGMTMPSMSIEEIDKQITDLKAVESWLNLNMNMLRGTIQALEVQSGTLSALKSMSDSMAAMVKPGTAPSGKPAAPSSASSAPSASAGQGAASAGTANARTSPPAFDFSAFSMPKPAPAPSQASATPEVQAGVTPPAADKEQEKSGKPGEESATTATVFADPAAWWNLLQEQFKKAVDAAMAPAPDTTPSSGAAGKPAGRAVAKSDIKPAKPAAGRATVANSKLTARAAGKSTAAKSSAGSTAAKNPRRKSAPGG